MSYLFSLLLRPYVYVITRIKVITLYVDKLISLVCFITRRAKTKDIEMKTTLFFIFTLASISSFAKVAKHSVDEDLNFKFEVPKKEIQRSLASEKEKKEKADAPRDPASTVEIEDQVQPNGIQFWKF